MLTYTCMMTCVLVAVQLNDAIAEKHDTLSIDVKFAVLEQRLDNLEAEHIDLKVKDETLQQRIQNLEAENIDLKDKLEKSENEKVEFWNGFTAYATRDRVYDPGDTIRYDGIVTNRGSFYNPLTSIFTCGFSGYYLFAVTNKAPYGNYIYTEMIVGNTVVAVTYSYEGADSASNIALVFCEEDDEVFVRVVEDSGSTGRLVGGDKPESTFSGTLMSMVQNVQYKWMIGRIIDV